MKSQTGQSADLGAPGARAACGPRAVEEGLLSELDAACARAAREPHLLARPLRVVVPSGALREQTSCALVARGRARVGLRVQTLESLAHEVLERAGESAPPSLLLGEAVREFARREPALARDLDRLEDGYAAVFASVEDLLDAGYTELHLEPLLERAAEATSGSALARAAALLRVAAQVSRELAEQTLGHRSRELARASDLLRADAALLPTRALWIHGFADATGIQLDLLETLAQRLACRVWLDCAGHQAGAFGARLRERLAPIPVLVAVPATDAHISASRHADPECEARAAAAWARERLEAGIAPERIAIIARDLARHRLALRRQLGRFGVPFSGVAERGATTPAGRQLAVLCDLLERGGALPADRWLDGLGAARAGAASRADLRDALHVLGIASLADLAAAAPASWCEGVALRARTRLALDEDGASRAARRRVGSERLDALREAAIASLRWFESDPARAPLSARAARLAELVSALGWSPDTPGHAELAIAVAALAGAGERALSREDTTRVLRRALGDASSDPLGGRGGGVQVLSVMEARARTFDAVRVIGLERGVFPRRVTEDPLLSDALRRALRDVLPDLPVKAEGHEEERFLFAQLCAAAPQVHLSCAQRDATGRATPPSPLFERAAVDRVENPELEARSPRDALLATARDESRADFAAVLPAALAEARRAVGLGEPAPSLAAARLAVLRELDPRDARRRELGPFLGAVGPPLGSADPRRSAPSVTHLENTARCPWQAFLSRMLGIEPAPDAHGALPQARDRRLVGTAVHTAIEFACQSAAWPEAVRPDLILEAARLQAERAGIALRGFAHALARAASPYVEVARRLDAAERATLRGVETDGVVSVRDARGSLRQLRFRADRVEEVGGLLRRTDWKTGKPKSLQEHRNGLARGELLQVHAYSQDGAAARYVYLDPELDDAARVLEADAIDPGRAGFDASVAALLAARDAGAFPPRLRRPDRDEETSACRRCDLRPACLRGDSGARMRLAAWADAQREGSELDRAALAVWRLPGSAT